MDMNYILIMKVPFFLLGLALYMICCRTKQRDPDEDDLIVPQPRLSSSIYIIPMHNEEGEEGEEEEDDEDAEHLCGFSSPPRYSDPPSYNSLSLHCPPPYCQADVPPPPYIEDCQLPMGHR